MPKRKPNDWYLLDRLHKAAAKLDEVGAHKANSLIRWHRETGNLTEKQVTFAQNLIARAASDSKRRRKAKAVPHYLYAISDGVAIKLGFSRNPDNRRKDMQTGQAVALKVIWEMEVGNSPGKASQAERKLHRYCAKFRKRGEWFSLDCMTLVRQFEIYQKAKKENESMQPDEMLVAEKIELEILGEAKQRIG